MRDDKREIRFGTLAVEKGFITGRQLGRAVSEQMKEDLGQDIHRFLGEILVAMGFIDTSQVEEVLQALKQQMPSK
jgi:hypothetical protein